jgi:small-conductance mechanosensitive channel
MCKLFKAVFIIGLVGLGTFGVACAVLGKQRAHDTIKSLQKMAQGEADQLIKKQNDMKEQLAKLREQYPKQVAALRAQQADIDEQTKQLDKETAKCGDILALCDADLNDISASRKRAGNATITFRGSKYSPTDADALFVRINKTREIYATRQADIKVERETLDGEKAQIAQELDLVKAEQEEFEAQYQALVREIDRVKHNQELLNSAEKRKGYCGNRHEESMETLSQLKSALNKARMEQEERMKSLKITPRQQDYETRAKVVEIEREREAKRKTEGASEEPTPKSEQPADEETEDEDAEFAIWR